MTAAADRTARCTELVPAGTGLVQTYGPFALVSAISRNPRRASASFVTATPARGSDAKIRRRSNRHDPGRDPRARADRRGILGRLASQRQARRAQVGNLG